MRVIYHSWLFLGVLSMGSVPGFAKSPGPDELVSLASIDASIIQDIKYASEDNFMKAKLYPVPICVVRREVGEALARVQQKARLQGVKLKVWDCYRPASIQKRMWEKVRDDRYVANPADGGSKHNRGAAVDITLVTNNGEDVEMPTAYDDFSPKAHRDYKGGTRKSLLNRAQLEKLMVAEGFIPLPTEWWHFDYRGWEKYPVLDLPLNDFK